MRISSIAKYGKSFQTGLKAALEYRLNFFISFAGAIAPIVIQTALWLVLYDDSPGREHFGFTYPQMMAYTVLAQLISRLVRTGFEYELNQDIRTGSLDRYLAKPISYFGFRLFSFMGDKIVQLLFSLILLAIAILSLAAFAGFVFVPVSAIYFAFGLFVAFLLNFLLFWCVGLAGFWLTEIGFLFEAIRIVIIAASGGIFPLSVFGSAGERVLSLLPFRYTIQFPVELLTGRLPRELLLPSFLISAFWIAALTVLSRALWKAGLRRFAAVGS